MPKHVKIRGELTAGRKAVKVTVIEQTHFQTEFGDTVEERYSTFGTFGFKHEGTFLYSHGEDRTTVWLDYLDPKYTMVCLPASPDMIAKRPSMMVTLNEFKKIKAAVEAYNEHFKEKEDGVQEAANML